MKKSTETISSKDDLLADDESWINIIEPELCKDSAAVELLARLLFTIKKEINSGSAGVRRASKILSNGIEVLYLYTSAHKAALELYVLSLAGELKPQDEPLNLINAAIERGKRQRKG
ncbi:MAG TPA: hypothetical protein VEX70_16410 [Pyrinomonadaceae bacterium]|nr:hypothetical protein [Pyrinomonadaceae bacterium]